MKEMRTLWIVGWVLLSAAFTYADEMNAQFARQKLIAPERYQSLSPEARRGYIRGLRSALEEIEAVQREQGLVLTQDESEDSSLGDGGLPWIPAALAESAGQSCIVGGKIFTQARRAGRWVCPTAGNGCPGQKDGGFACGTIYGKACVSRYPIETLSARCHASGKFPSDRQYAYVRETVENFRKSLCEESSRAGSPCDLFSKRIDELNERFSGATVKGELPLIPLIPPRPASRFDATPAQQPSPEPAPRPPDAPTLTATPKMTQPKAAETPQEKPSEICVNCVSEPKPVVSCEPGALEIAHKALEQGLVGTVETAMQGDIDAALSSSGFRSALADYAQSLNALRACQRQKGIRQTPCGAPGSLSSPLSDSMRFELDALYERQSVDGPACVVQASARIMSSGGAVLAGYVNGKWSIGSAFGKCATRPESAMSFGRVLTVKGPRAETGASDCGAHSCILFLDTVNQEYVDDGKGGKMARYDFRNHQFVGKPLWIGDSGSDYKSRLRVAADSGTGGLKFEFENGAFFTLDAASGRMKESNFLAPSVYQDCSTEMFKQPGSGETRFRPIVAIQPDARSRASESHPDGKARIN